MPSPPAVLLASSCDAARAAPGATQFVLFVTQAAALWRAPGSWAEPGAAARLGICLGQGDSQRAQVTFAAWFFGGSVGQATISASWLMKPDEAAGTVCDGGYRDRVLVAACRGLRAKKRVLCQALCAAWMLGSSLLGHARHARKAGVSQHDDLNKVHLRRAML